MAPEPDMRASDAALACAASAAISSPMTGTSSMAGRLEVVAGLGRARGRAGGAGERVRNAPAGRGLSRRPRRRNTSAVDTGTSGLTSTRWQGGEVAQRVDDLADAAHVAGPRHQAGRHVGAESERERHQFAAAGWRRHRRARPSAAARRRHRPSRHRGRPRPAGSCRGRSRARAARRRPAGAEGRDRPRHEVGVARGPGAARTDR